MWTQRVDPDCLQTQGPLRMRASLCVSREGGLTGGVEVCPQGVTSGV